jgi:hypothetical protein
MKYSEAEAGFLASIYARDKCSQYKYPHQFHCFQLSNDQIGRPRVSRQTCWRWQEAYDFLISSEKPVDGVAAIEPPVLRSRQSATTQP